MRCVCVCVCVCVGVCVCVCVCVVGSDPLCNSFPSKISIPSNLPPHPSQPLSFPAAQPHRTCTHYTTRHTHIIIPIKAISALPSLPHKPFNYTTECTAVKETVWLKEARRRCEPMTKRHTKVKGCCGDLRSQRPRPTREGEIKKSVKRCKRR